ncbi:MAG: hypothetical protein H6765_02270 [Candidatus Peribacteria bacterium]|nr:MAG: hypothetical protein H6765_02270 [Candidatus Peribacteria bacterium]
MLRALASGTIEEVQEALVQVSQEQQIQIAEAFPHLADMSAYNPLVGMYFPLSRNATVLRRADALVLLKRDLEAKLTA